TFVFRLAENDRGPGAWLTTAGIDPRHSPLPPEAFVIGTTGAVNGPDPSLYEDTTAISAPDRALDRATDSFSYNEDTPVFELPRSPLLSLGALQHLPLAGLRPFSAGNSWGAADPINGIPSAQLFDRFFFSGLASEVTPTGSGSSLLLPNPLLRVSPRKPDGTVTTATDLVEAPNARSSKFLLQGGAFNLNSVNPAAWAAVLRGVRFLSSNRADQFEFLDASFDSGTAADLRDGVPSSNSRDAIKKLATDPEIGEAGFFRFSQSAQETYKAYPNFAASNLGNPELGEPPNPVSAARTDLFRKGMRKLTPTQVAALATNIADAIKARQGAGGPFRSLEEFLSPIAVGAPSLLEQAIADAGINMEGGNPIEFSSQWLTQADIMTALAPVLFARSDTFVIRAYGEAVNPATNATEGRAWCEATVQRVPEYFHPADPAETNPADFDQPSDPADPASEPTAAHKLNKLYGRRFKVVSFRWLTRSDI
ncbi:MAG: hypothetical protein ABIZ49_02220, partial [Opitutaceae bacterium]